jgi:SHS2 domain-containing protein
MASIEVLSHTADTGIEVGAVTFAELAEGAASGMATLVFGDDAVGSAILDIPVRVTATSPEDLLVAWLEELLVIGESRHLALLSFSVEDVTEWRLRGLVGGVDAEEIELVGSPIKAITHHGLVVARDGAEWRARVYFDV